MTMYELSDPTAEQILISDHERGSAGDGSCLDRDYSGGSSQSELPIRPCRRLVSPVAWSNDSEIFHQKTITVDGVRIGHHDREPHVEVLLDDEGLRGHGLPGERM